jgi:restriction system protein
VSIPTTRNLMLPLLRIAGDEKEHTLRESIAILAEHFNLTEEERRELQPSGKQTKFEKRVGWARMYLTKLDLIKPVSRGCFVVTQFGLETLATNIDGLKLPD